MFSGSTKHKGLFVESDSAAESNFRDAGFGFNVESETLFHPLEAGYLVKIGKAEFKAGSLAAFISSQKKKDKLFPFALAVYEKIRANGRQVLPFMKGIKYLRAYAPGVGRLAERPSQLVCLLPGKEPSAKTLAGEVKIAHLARLDLLIAIGSGEEIKFYKISAYNF